jgi:tetraacyldisaccharide 4'-kinase
MLQDLSAPDFWWQRTATLSAKLLSPLGAAYGWLTTLRMTQSPKGRADVPVLCIGNLVLGGAGKTPTVLALIDELEKLGYKPGVLLRGYGGSEKGPLRVTDSHMAEQVGDEALLYRRVVPTVISADRVAGAGLLATTGIDVILMDDGFQNPSLHRDLSLVVVDTQTGWGNGLCCPAGPLRASVDSQLIHASAIIALGSGPHLIEAENAASKHGIALYRGSIVPQPVSPDLAGRRFVAYSGIGRPEKFFNSLEAANLDIVETLSFADHHLFTEQDAEKILSRCRSHEAVPITTEKDYVRLLSATPHTFAAELRQVSLTLKIHIEWQNPDRMAEVLRGVMTGSGEQPVQP